MGVSGQWYERTGTEEILKNLKEQLEIADRYQPPYGLVDVAASQDCCSGFVYTSCWFGNSPLHRWVEDFKFRYACSKRRDQARGVYWGNYFGPAILERLGGRVPFVARCRGYVQAATNGQASALIWEFNNGVFVSLCLDPLGCKPGPPLDLCAAANFQWLVLELGSHGVLCPWSPEGEKP